MRLNHCQKIVCVWTISRKYVTGHFSAKVFEWTGLYNWQQKHVAGSSAANSMWLDKVCSKCVSGQLAANSILFTQAEVVVMVVISCAGFLKILTPLRLCSTCRIRVFRERNQFAQNIIVKQDQQQKVKQKVSETKRGTPDHENHGQFKKKMKRRRLGDGVVWGWARGQK